MVSSCHPCSRAIVTRPLRAALDGEGGRSVGNAGAMKRYGDGDDDEDDEEEEYDNDDGQCLR
eukprot:9474895-Pyramimonas_sp.AAC.2